MAILLDSSDLAQVERFHRMGIIRGVTTNPTILLKDGVSGGLTGIEARAKAIAALIAPYDLSIEVTSNEPQEMLRQAQLLAGWASNIVVKITVHGPNGELENNVIEWLEAGAHNVTVAPQFLEGMLIHPYTKETVQMFLRDAAKLGPSS